MPEHTIVFYSLKTLSATEETYFEKITCMKIEI